MKCQKSKKKKISDFKRGKKIACSQNKGWISYQQYLMLEINMVMNLKKKLLCKKNYFKPRVIYPTTLLREREQDFCLKKKKLKHLHLQTCILQEK